MAKTSTPGSSQPAVDRREARRVREARRKRQRNLALGIAGLGILILIGLIWWNNRPVTAENLKVFTEQPATANGFTWGGQDAKVVLVDYSDFQCSFCGRHAIETVPQLIERYSDNPNFRYEYRPYVLFRGSASQTAAEAAVCAAEQNRFWPYHDTLFANQGAEQSGIFTEANLKVMAREVGLDMNAFNDCFDSGRAKRDVNDVIVEGEKAGVSSTPSFFLNGKLISGAQPASAFFAEIDAALAANP